MNDRPIRLITGFAAIVSSLVFGMNVLAQVTSPAVPGTENEACSQYAITCWERLADKAHGRGDVEREIQLRTRVSQLAWDNWGQHPNIPGRWNRWAIVYENDLPLARLLEGTHRWSEAEVAYRHSQSELKHERLAGDDIKSEIDLELAHLLLKEHKEPEAKSICAHWKNKVKHNADYALYAVKHDVPVPPLYDTPEVEIAKWTLACEQPDDGISLLKAQTKAHPGMLAPFTAMANYYTSEGDFRTALEIEKNGTSALMSTPNAARE